MKVNVGMYVEKYAWVLSVLLLTLLAYVCAKMTNAWVQSAYAMPTQIQAWTPPAPDAVAIDTRPKTNLRIIEERNLFGAKIREETLTPESEEEVVMTNLNFSLQGIIVGPKWRLATIENKDNKKIHVLGVGEEAATGITIYSIEPDRVILARSDGRKEELMLDYHTGGPPRKGPQRSRQFPPRPRAPPTRPSAGGQGVRAVSETEYVIDRDEFDAQLSNINDLVTKARVVPNFTPDRQVDGFRMFQIHPGSIYQKLGLQNGDVIQFVNGIKMDDPTKGLELFQALQDQSHFTIDLKRRNQKMTFSYDVR